jgi:DNA-binding beta-propeller fold protein YncE
MEGAVPRLFRASLLLFLALALLPVPRAHAFEWLGQYGRGSFTLDSGGLGTVVGIAASPDGTLVFSDISGQRVSLFAADGRFLSNSGKDVSVGGGTGAEVCVDDCKGGEAGTAAGELASPWGVAAGPEEFFVSELNNSRVSVFDYQGHFLRAFGADVGGPGVDVCTSACGPGTSGAGDGQMAGPAGIALDAAGDLLVSELGTHRVDSFDPRSGQFLGAFGKDVGGPGVDTCTSGCAAGTADETPGSLNVAYGLAVAPDGDVVVSDNTTDTISVFTGQGQFLRRFGGPGSGAGEMYAPLAVAVGSDGNVYVSEGPNNRFSVFDLDGDFLRAYGKDVIPGGPGIAEMCTTECQAGASDYGIGELSFPEAIGADDRGDVYVDTFARVDKWGEPPTAEPEPPAEPSTHEEGVSPKAKAPAGAVASPSNAFRFGRVRVNRKKGIVLVDVLVPGPGSLGVKVGHRLKVAAAVPQPAAAGAVTVRLKAIHRGLRTLRRQGRLWGTLWATFTPASGSPNMQSKAIRLRKKRRRGA